MIKIAHIADTHIRNLKYHEEYKVAFDDMYRILRENKVDYIVHCGDIAHTKTQISPEFVEMAAGFFKNLADIAPTYIILGNHDGNLKNSGRQDAITPIIDALQHSNLHLLKNAGETNIGSNITLNVLSVFDEENWVKPTDSSRINIALYHGAVSGVTTDTGWVMDHGDHDVSVFEDFDYAMLGDIHKTNQILDVDGRVRYPGSTIQQNHGETNDKGFLLWKIEDKDNFGVDHYTLKNPKPFVTVQLTKAGRLPTKAKVPVGARLRLVSNYSIPLNKLRKAIDAANKKYEPSAITFLNKAHDERGSVDVSGGFVQEDLRDIAVQEKFIKEYLEDYGASEDVLDRVYELNKRYTKIVEDSEIVKRNINWRIKRLEWDNLFNYGESNHINFDELNGIVGIFGKNFSGKSSIIDSLLFTLYNTTSKGNRKNLNTINQDKMWGRGKAEIEVGGKVLHIERRAEKYTKKLKGVETVEAKTDVDFWAEDLATGEKQSLNGLDRNGTDKNIRKFFGTVDDFFLTSMATQLGSLAFISEGSTKRKEILAKFLDLEIFDDKFKLAKDDASDLRGIIRRLEEIDFPEEIEETNKSLREHNQQIFEHKETCSSLKDRIEQLKMRSVELQETIGTIPATIIDDDAVREKLASVEGDIEKLLSENKRSGRTSKTNRELSEKISAFIDDFDIDEYSNRQLMITNMNDGLANMISEIDKTESFLKVEQRKVQLLDQVPCGEQYPQCRFIKDAFTALESVGLTRDRLKEMKKEKEKVGKRIDELEPDTVAEYITKYNQVLEKKKDADSVVNQMELKIAKNKTKILRLKNEASELNALLNEYEENKEAIENLEELTEEQQNTQREISSCEDQIDECETTLMQLYRTNGSLGQKKEDLEAQLVELVETRENYSAFDLFMSCMHTNGISLDIIKNKLPVLNEEIASVLANIVDFEVYLQNEDKKLEMFIKHPKYDARPLEMGSGAEKTIAAMAIRLALLNVSSLPKGDLFILDEPGTALDEENMEGFIRILDLVKSNFKTVLLISHLDSLKDAVDSQISIEKKRNFASVRH